MKLVMTLLVRNEEDVLAANIEYHLARGVDFIIATDNRSEDGTREILESYRAKGVLRVIEEPSDDYDQRRWVTRMARLARREHAADWVINADADEFWWPTHAASLVEALASCPGSTDAVLAARHDFVPLRQPASTSIVHAMTTRRAVTVNAHGEPPPPKICHRAHKGVVVGQGNHDVYRRRGLLRRLRRLEAEERGLEILHFPLRTYAQFERKIALGGAAYTRNSSVSKSEGSTWRMLYEQYLAGDLPRFFEREVPSDADLAQGLADGRYVEDLRLATFLDERVALPV